jgi:hypothetical protein
MEPQQLKVCSECRVSHHLKIRNLKNAVLESRRNIPRDISGKDKLILEDYVHKNVIKKPEHIVHLSRMALPKNTLWNNGRVLTVSFMGGKKKIQDAIKEQAVKWMRHCNIELVFTKTKKPTDVRIAFVKKEGSWSYMGTEILTIAANKSTMNFGWFTEKTDEEEYQRTVLHEFGHTIGCMHEHENPKGGIKWNKKLAYTYYMEQGWSKEEVDEQVFSKLSINSIRGTKIDKNSIMMYPIPNEITLDDFEVGWNNDLSVGDKKFIAKIYPKK